MPSAAKQQLDYKIATRAIALRISKMLPGIIHSDQTGYVKKCFIGQNIRLICNGNKSEWSPIRSVIIRVITKSDDHAAGVRFVNHEYDYRPNWTTRSLITN